MNSGTRWLQLDKRKNPQLFVKANEGNLETRNLATLVDKCSAERRMTKPKMLLYLHKLPQDSFDVRQEKSTPQNYEKIHVNKLELK